MNKILLEEYIKAWQLYLKSDSPLDLDYVRHMHYKIEKQIDEEYLKFYDTEGSELHNKIHNAKNIVNNLLNKFSSEKISYQDMMKKLKNDPNNWKTIETKGSWGSPIVQKVKDSQGRIWSKSMLSGNFELDT